MVIWCSKYRLRYFGKSCSKYMSVAIFFLVLTWQWKSPYRWCPIPMSDYQRVRFCEWKLNITSSGWWFQTFGLFSISYIGDFIIPTDEFIFFRGVGLNHQPGLLWLVGHVLSSVWSCRSEYHITLWLCQNSYWTLPLKSWIYPAIKWWCSIVFCWRLLEGSHF